jgi:hypothetical protein
VAGAVPVAAVEDRPLVQHDRLWQPVRAVFGDELAELGAVDREQREQGGGGWACSSSAGGVAGWSAALGICCSWPQRHPRSFSRYHTERGAFGG